MKALWIGFWVVVFLVMDFLDWCWERLADQVDNNDYLVAGIVVLSLVLVLRFFGGK